MSLDMYPKTIARPTAIRVFKAIIPRNRLKKLGPHREISALLVSKYKGGTIDKELEHLGYPVIVKRCSLDGATFYVVSYRNGSIWEILSVLKDDQYQEIIRTLKEEAMLLKLIGSNIHTRN